jgi:DNA mismatch repair protein MutL
MTIRVLPPDVAGKIAAGEVVERPASVVKELVENALDAGATDIHVEIRRGGKQLIRVRDNGQGIPAAEVEMAFAHHATSKLTSADDLFDVQTLGFRGEALPSIAAVAQVTLITCAAGEEAGSHIQVVGGQIVSRRPQGRPRGTTVVVENLFFNTPARRKFLRSTATEAAWIANLVSSYALAYPERRFTLINDGRRALQSPGTGDLHDALIAVYGMDVRRQMLPLPDDDESIRVTGYVGVPSLHRANRKYITCFVNGRWVRDAMLNAAVTQAYRGVVPTGRFPVAVVHVRLPTGDLDVNVHPAKTEVKFRDSNAVFRAVERKVRRVLVDEAPVAAAQRLTRRAEGSEPIPGFGGRSTAQGALALEVQRTAGMARPGDEVPLVDEHVPRRLPVLRVLGQVHQTYIIAEGPDGLYLIDQHTAHERVLLERLRGQRARMAVPSQSLLEPVAVEFSPEQQAIVEEQRETLAALGFALEPFGGNTWLVRAIPEVLRRSDCAAALAEILDNAWRDRSELSWEERVLMYAACRGAVKAGDPLSMQEMRSLIRQLEETDMSRTCAHGRPTVIRLSQAQLEREFGRR